MFNTHKHSIQDITISTLIESRGRSIDCAVKVTGRPTHISANVQTLAFSTVKLKLYNL